MPSDRGASPEAQRTPRDDRRAQPADQMHGPVVLGDLPKSSATCATTEAHRQRPNAPRPTTDAHRQLTKCTVPSASATCRKAVVESIATEPLRGEVLAVYDRYAAYLLAVSALRPVDPSARERVRLLKSLR